MSALKHMLSLQEWSTTDLMNLLALSEANLGLRNSQKQAGLDGKIQVNLFFENSTRTRTSFEVAGKRLGLHVININIATSSINKGETLRDTILNIQAMNPNLIVMRHNISGAAKFVADILDDSGIYNSHLINAGDGLHAHPSQALLDALTIYRKKGCIAGLNIAICGDILHSRVARSDIICLSKLGANIRLIAPSTLLPYGFENMGLEHYTSLEKGIAGQDVIIMLRLQKERMAGCFIPSINEYNKIFGLTKEKLALAKQDCIVLHPGPVNRGVEIDPGIIECDHSQIFDQVNNGVAARMAIIETLLRTDNE